MRVLDERTVAFPNYDGNGMYLSMGNVLENPHVGMLFIDFTAARPSRLRLNGVASIDESDELIASYPGAQFVVRVRATQVFPNCPRYIHRMALVERSRFVPRADRRRRSRTGSAPTGPATCSRPTIRRGADAPARRRSGPFPHWIFGRYRADICHLADVVRELRP